MYQFIASAIQLRKTYVHQRDARGGVVVGYVPTFDITFGFDEEDCLSKISIFIAADE